MKRLDDRAGTALNAVGALAIVGVVAFLVVVIAPGVIGAEGSYVVQSGSMEPAIGAGDLIVVQSVAPATIEEGDVVTYTGGELATGQSGTVTHRVIDVRETEEGRRFVTRGDANENPDPESVRPDQIVGTVWFTVPLVGYLVAFAGSDLGIVTFVVVPGALLVATELRSLYRDAQVSSAEEEEKP